MKRLIKKWLLRRRLARGYKANAELELKICDDWKYVDAEFWDRIK